jgi:hypothetical protein
MTFKEKLKETISQNLTYKGFLCFGILLNNIHQEKYTDKRIKISKKIMKRLNLLHRFQSEKVIKGKSFDLFMRAEDASVDILIIKNRIDCLPDHKRFMRISHKQILSSEDVIRYSGLQSGKDIGNIINEVKRAQYEGRIRNRAAGIKLVRKLSANI